MTRSNRLSPKQKPEPGPAEFAFEAIGTRWEIKILEVMSVRSLARLRTTVLARIDQFDRNYSRFRGDSLVTRLSREGGSVELPDDAEPLFDLYDELFDITGGRVTPLIGKVMEDAGYDPSYSLKPGELKTPPSWDEIVEYSFPTLTLAEPALLDLGAAGKGYIVDLVGELLEETGHPSYVINAGGDIRYRNETGEALAVGLEHPEQPGTVIGVAQLPAGMSICGSGGGRRKWDRFTHIIDPKELTSPTQISADWVIADSTLLADGLSTALFFVAPQTLLARYNFKYAILRDDNSLLYSPDISAEIFSEE
jgi:thiamine biosynthesis lipoprotein